MIPHYDEYGNGDNPTILLLHGAGVLDPCCGQCCFSEQFRTSEEEGRIVRICRTKRLVKYLQVFYNDIERKIK